MSSSFEKGDRFEKKAYETIKRLVENDDFFTPAKRSKVFWKKGYYSPIRKSEIIFDISIETYINNSPQYSTLTLIECKNLGRKVDVADVSVFSDYINQIGQHNTKGVFITSVGFQEGAYHTAVSLGIGLIRLTSNDEYDWINYRKEKFIENVLVAQLPSLFSDETLKDRNLIAVINNQPLYNLADVLIQSGNIDFYQHKETFLKIPYVTAEKIQSIIKRLETYNVYDSGKIDFEKTCEVLKESYKMEFDFDKELPNSILGKIEFDPLKISLTNSLKKDLKRWRFTLAHEIGHLILHSRILRFSVDQKFDNSGSLALDHSISDATTRQLEFQANLFARHLLMPNHYLGQVVTKYFKENNINKPFLVLDEQSGNRQLVFSLLNQISSKFEVSVEAAKIRLKAVALLKDSSDNVMQSLFRQLGYK